jgi:glucosamine--fructose-6-phosphate aminotransferase (isomerizing)
MTPVELETQVQSLIYASSPYAYRRRKTREVKVGDVGVGGNNPIRVQSMTTTDTMNTDATVAQAIRDARGTFLVGCGTAGKACMAAEYFFSVVAEHHVNFAPGSEFKLYHHFLRPESLLIAVSQSGETADVLEAIAVAKSKGSKVLAIVNVAGSSISRAADYTLLINAGPERAVASTKALTGQLAVLLLVDGLMRQPETHHA